MYLSLYGMSLLDVSVYCMHHRKRWSPYSDNYKSWYFSYSHNHSVSVVSISLIWKFIWMHKTYIPYWDISTIFHAAPTQTATHVSTEGIGVTKSSSSSSTNPSEDIGPTSTSTATLSRGDSEIAEYWMKCCGQGRVARAWRGWGKRDSGECLLSPLLPSLSLELPP